MISNNDGKSPVSANTLRKPVQILKKRSGPLEDVLNELQQLETSGKCSQEENPTGVGTSKECAIPNIESVNAALSHKRRPTLKEKDKKRERWLLTRKTWKYMTDAGRKLIPDSAQNRKEDIPRIEAHFQHMCSTEPRFVLWRRKTSYPGASRSSKRRLKQLVRHTGQRHARTSDIIQQVEARNISEAIELLQTYLKLDESFKTTTLLGSKTVRPDQTFSPSAQRPDSKGRHTQFTTNTSLRGPGFLSQPSFRAEYLNEIDQLLASIKSVSQNIVLGNISLKPDDITPDLLKDKTLLKQIYNTLKKQQLHRTLGKHSNSTNIPESNLSHAASLSTIFNFGVSGIYPVTTVGTDYRLAQNTIGKTANCREQDNSRIAPITNRQRNPPSSLDLNEMQIDSNRPTAPTRRKGIHQTQKQYNHCGTQTNFIQLSEIKRLAEEYKAKKREEAINQVDSTKIFGLTDDETEKSPSMQTGRSHNRRKSSIDNEDVSQSVSDTIKRYLRMARKKSVHDTDQASRFKRVNYDRNLRNIRAKGEINPPGMDDGLSKAVQTLDAWPLITLDFIRGNENSGLLEAAHSEWQQMLEERIQKKLDFEAQQDQKEKEKNQKNKISNWNSLSAPTSPVLGEQSLLVNTESPSSSTSLSQMQPLSSNAGGIFVTGSHFLANLWHGNTAPFSSISSTCTNKQPQLDSKNADTSMQKSRSSSNVGQFVSRKILRSRSKSQTRPFGEQSLSIAPKSVWTPTDNLRWVSENGDFIQLTDTSLQKLSDIETKLLQRVAIEKISELNLGVHLSCDYKAQKRRILPKKKAITTSFFDISKKDEQSGRCGLFGNSLECCIANDRKRYAHLNSSSNHGSRSSLVSLFRISGTGSSSTTNKLNENVRSCESLPSTALDVGNSNRATGLPKSTSGYFSNLRKSASSQLSRSQVDMRRKSQELDINFNLNNSVSESTNAENIEDLTLKKDTDLQVPNFVTSCINYLEQNGLNKVGLFRVSTSKKRIKQMREDFDKNIINTIDEDTCPHDVATLLKEFLRDLPEPLLCNHLYNAFIETQKIRNRRLQMEGISHLIKLLPVTHRDTLYVLLKFLAKVASYSDDIINSNGSHETGNKMDSNNLATVFAPNILRTTTGLTNDSMKERDLSEKESMSDAINVIRIMIDHYEELFKVPAELIDVVYSHMMDECPDNLYLLCEQRNLISPSNPDHEILSSSQAVRSNRKLYTRESVIHHNDASRTPDIIRNETNDSKRSHTNRDTSYSVSHRERARHSGRRQSNPVSIDKSGASNVSRVLSASLQITAPSLCPKYSSEHNDYEEVFYDSPSSSSHGERETNSDLSFIDNENPSADKNFYENSQGAAARDMNIKDHLKSKLHENIEEVIEFRLRKNDPEQPGPNSNIKNKTTRNEPKQPASITNIGGAILRSKTADFEKISQQRESVNSQTSSTNKAQRTDSNTKQHLYKRQQLIPSAKHIQPKDSK